MIIKRKYYSEKKNKEDDKKSSKLSKSKRIAGSLGVGLGAGLTTTASLLNKVDNKYKDAVKVENNMAENLLNEAQSKYYDTLDDLDRKSNEISEKIKNSYKSQEEKLKNFFGDLSKVRNAKHRFQDMAKDMHRKEYEKIMKDHKDILSNLKKIRKRKMMNRLLVGTGVGLGTGLGTYYLSGKVKNKKGKEDDN